MRKMEKLFVYGFSAFSFLSLEILKKEILKKVSMVSKLG